VIVRVVRGVHSVIAFPGVVATDAAIIIGDDRIELATDNGAVIIPADAFNDIDKSMPTIECVLSINDDRHDCVIINNPLRPSRS